MNFLLILSLITIFSLISIIISDVFFTTNGRRLKMKTEYDSSIKGLIITISASVVLGIFIPVVIYQISDGDMSNAIVQYIGTIIGSILSVCGAILAVLITLKKQKQKQDAEQKVHKKLKLKKLYSTLNIYLMNNSFFSMSTERLIDKKLIYNYAHDFLDLHSIVYKELAQISEELFDEFDYQMEDEFNVSIWVLNFEKIESSKFMADLLNVYGIFKDEIARKALNDTEKTDFEERYDYTQFQVFLVLEAHLQVKLRLFMDEIKGTLKEL